jgi:hypothetical protein
VLGRSFVEHQPGDTDADFSLCDQLIPRRLDALRSGHVFRPQQRKIYKMTCRLMGRHYQSVNPRRGQLPGARGSFVSGVSNHDFMVADDLGQRSSLSKPVPISILGKRAQKIFGLVGPMSKRRECQTGRRFTGTRKKAAYFQPQAFQTPNAD